MPTLRWHWKGAAVDCMIQTKIATGPCLTSAASYKNNSNSGPKRSGFRDAALMSVLLGILIFAQTMGLMHGLLHAPFTQGAPAPHAHQHADADTPDHGSHWLETLFAGHEEGGGSCRVFDQQGHSAPLMALAALALPSVLHAALPAEGIACHLALAAAPFQARAPPFHP